MGAPGHEHELAIARDFYSALVARDGAKVEGLVVDHFSPSAFLERPAALPGGGVVQGPARIARFFRFVAEMESGPVDVRQIEVGAILAGGTRDRCDVAVEMVFAYQGVPSRAVEWWTFERGAVAELRVYYWDTAGMLALGAP